MTHWQRFRRTFGSVLEGSLAATASTVVSGALTVSVGRGPVFYTLTALVLIVLYLGYRLS